MPETPNTVKKQVYVSKQNLQTILEFLRDKNAALYLGKHATADEAAKVSKSLKITVGDNPQIAFNGEVEEAIEVAAKVHKHAASDITDLKSAVNKIVFGKEDNTGIVMAHEHLNLSVLDGISSDDVSAWDAKIGVDDVARLKYTNTAMTGVEDVKTAIDVLVKNIQINSAALTDATANVNGLATRLTTAEGNISTAQTDIAALKTAVGDADSGLTKKVADLEKANAEGGAVANKIKEAKDAADAAQATANQAVAAAAAEAERAKGVEAGLQNSINAINNAETGILKQAKDYTDAREVVLDGKITTAQNAANAAQADVDALEGVVGKAGDTSDKTTVFGKIAKLNEDLAAETNRATGVEQGLRTDVDAVQDAIDILNGADTVEGSVNKKIKDAITEVNTAAGNLEGRVKKNEDAIAVINGTGEGSIKKAVADLVGTAPENMDTLQELAQAINDHQDVYEGYIETVNGQIEAAKNAAISAAAKDASDKDDALKSALETKIGEKVDKTVYDAKVAELVKADTDNLAAAKKFAQDEDKKITDVIGTATDGLGSTTVFGKIKLLEEKDAAQDQVINTKATAADLDALEALVGGKTDTKDDDTVFGAIAKEADRAKAAEGALDGRLTTAETKITALEATVDTATTGLKDRVAAAETDIDNLQSDMTSAKVDINNINTNITSIQNTLLNLVPLGDDELQAMLNAVYTN